MVISGKQKKKKFDQNAYAKKVLSSYGAECGKNTGCCERYCNFTGWYPAKQVKCAHLVPESPESEEL